MPHRTPPPPPPRRARRPAARAALLAAVALAGCEFPTELPILDTRWIIPAEETRFGVAELLPNAVSVTTTGNAFVVDFEEISFDETLGSLCPACIPAHGFTVPKPPFVGTFVSTIELPSAVVAISVISGDVIVTLENQMNFDPLRPAPGTFGEITLDLTDDADGDLLGTVTVEGSTQALPPGGVLTRTLTLAAATVEGSLEASVSVDSPLGDAVQIDVNDMILATVTPTNIMVASATIDAAGTMVSFDDVALDADLDEDMLDRILEGSFVLDVTNPFGVSADFTLDISGPGMPAIVKPETIGSGPSSTVVIPFTSAELRSFLGEQDATLSGDAIVDPSTPPFTVLPGQELVLDGKLDLTLRIGG